MESLGQHNDVKYLRADASASCLEAVCLELWQSLKHRATYLLISIYTGTLENDTLPTKIMIVNRPGTFHISSSLEIANRLEA